MAKFKVGIECESIEGKNSDLPAGRQVFGVGRIIVKLLEEISRHPELEKNYRFILYFKNKVSDFDFLKASLFETKIVPVPLFKNRLFPIYYFALLPMRLWFDRPDIMFWPNYMLPIIAFGKSVVMLTEDVYYESREGKLSFRYRLAYKIFCWWAAKFATKIMAISETSKKNLVKLYGIKPERIFVNYLGVDIENHKSQITNHKQPPTSKFQIPNSYILFVGQMFPRRHAKETILAFEKITREFPDLKLIAIGPDKYSKSIIEPLIKQVNDKLGKEAIVHKDYVKDSELAELYAGAKALVYVSDREAFGLPPMEALSFGVPPVIADNELGHELFEDFAFYSKNGNVDDIAEAIRQVLIDPEKIQKIKKSGPEFVKKYNWEGFADRFIKTTERM